MDKIFPQILESDLSIGFIALIFGFIQYYRAEGIENKINVSSKVPPILVSIGMLGTFVGHEFYHEFY
jgi:xanthosine utilization system XapX-like protein